MQKVSVREVAEAQAEPVAHRLRRVEQRSFAQGFAEGAAREFHRSLQLGILRQTHAGHGGEGFGFGAAHAGEVAEAGQQAACKVDGALAANPHAQEDGEQLGVREGAGATCKEFFARPFSGGPVGDCHCAGAPERREMRLVQKA